MLRTIASLQRYQENVKVDFSGDNDNEVAGKLGFGSWAERNGHEPQRAEAMAKLFVAFYRSKYRVAFSADGMDSRLVHAFGRVADSLERLREEASRPECEGSMFAANAIKFVTLLTDAPSAVDGSSRCSPISSRLKRPADALLGAFRRERIPRRRNGRPPSLARVCAEALLLAWWNAFRQLPAPGETEAVVDLLNGILPEGGGDSSAIRRAVAAARKGFGRHRRSDPWGT